jgi:hypothetical protein
MTATSDLTGASDSVSEMSLILALARRAVCLMCQIKMPSDLTSDFCLLGPIWVPYGCPRFPVVWVHTRPWQGRHVFTPMGSQRGMANKAVPRFGRDNA